MTVVVGEQVQAGPGSWGSPPTAYTYQWQDSLNGSTLNGNIAGETRSDYVVGSGELGRWLRIEVIATNAGGVGSPAYSDWIGPVGEVSIPVTVTAPVASGAIGSGSVVSTTDGTWTNTPTSFTYQWQSSANGTTGWGNLGGATAASYTIQVADETRFLRCLVTAHNLGGASTAEPSNVLGPVTGPVPGNSVLPVISGTAQVTEILSTTNGTWTNTPLTYAYQWQSSDNAFDWDDIPAATDDTYTIVGGDNGLYLRVGVTATNANGPSAAAYSDDVGPVTGSVPVNTGAPAVTGGTEVGDVLSSSTGTWDGDPTGYTYQWQSSEDGMTWEDVTGETDPEFILTPSDEGLYFRVGVVAENDDGVSDVAYSDTVGPVSPAPPPSEDPMAPCTPWITGDDVADCCSVEVSSGVVFDAVAEMASDLLFSISGRLFAGECSRTVRPACDECYCGYQVLSRGYVIGPWDYGYPLMLCDSCLTACDPSLVKLAGYPIREITEVKIDGDVVDPADYRVFNDRYLQRLDSERWPRSQNLTLPDTEDNTFSITYSFGASPPALGVAAAAQLGCELYKACSSGAGECMLPSGVTRLTRQGVTIDKLAFTSWGFREGRWATGLPLVDAFLGSVNPSGLQRRPTVWAPGKRQYSQSWG